MLIIYSPISAWLDLLFGSTLARTRRAVSQSPAETANFCVPGEPGCGGLLHAQSLDEQIRKPNKALLLHAENLAEDSCTASPQANASLGLPTFTIHLLKPCLIGEKLLILVL